MPAKKKPAKRPHGRKPGVPTRTTFRDWEAPEKLILIEGWARDGLTQEQIAENIGVLPQTLSSWKVKSAVIKEAIKQGREVVNRRLENALIKRALGFEFKEVTDQTGDKGYHKEVTKYVPPDTGALIFALVNRFPDHYKQKRADDDASDAALNKLDDVLSRIDKDVSDDAPEDTPSNDGKDGEK